MNKTTLRRIPCVRPGKDLSTGLTPPGRKLTPRRQAETWMFRWRRLVQSALWIGLVIQVSGQTFSRDLKVDIAVNQIGYTPPASKQCVIQETDSKSFSVMRTDGSKAVFTGALTEFKGDFGRFLVGDFSEVDEPGTYYITAGVSRSYPFRIGADVYDDAIEMIVGYFALQRCGPSATGYLAPCHTDDAVRLDNGRHQDTTGGWHDASDLRKWVGATIHGMIGLSHVYEHTRSKTLRARILEELRWGNRYFLNMQEPAGYVMSHVGGDALEHADGNRWTDNRIGPDGGEVKTTAPSPGRSTKRITIVGDKDDRVIKTDPLDRLGQYKFVIAQARMAHLVRSLDEAYADTCLAAAQRCYDWCRKDGEESTTQNLGGALSAATALYRATRLERFERDATADAARLAELQVLGQDGSPENPGGFYRQSRRNAQPYRDIWQGCWHLFGLCDLVELFPGHPDAEKWRAVIRAYTKDYLERLAHRNSFGIVPYGLFAEKDPGGNRRVGEYWYRYFMQPDRGWWVGINANVASAGIGLLRAANLLEDPSLRATAQRQLDWILGSNPLQASTVEGIGRNHPPPFINTVEFYPPTPRLPGAVMNGLGGTADDQPMIGEGIYHVSEYWTPMVAYTVWLMAVTQEAAPVATPNR